MLEEIARYEAMRAAVDQRYGLWAILFAVKPRVEEEEPEIRNAVLETLRSLYREGYIQFFRSPFLWGRRTLLDEPEIEKAFSDERNWKPRQLPFGTLVRISATEEGKRKFLQGEFGKPAPILKTPPPTAWENLELAPVTWQEIGAIFFAFLGFAVFAFSASAIIEFFQPGIERDFDLFQVLTMVFGGFAGSAIALVVWGKLFAEWRKRQLSKSRETVSGIIPDQYLQGPTLNPFDEFGNPRY
ncbi:MAG TPA: hypothetical protein VNK96_08100 [Fimbriimonadales bacterium]|nr:hypothetical protein [Fimbriimonadales bacterium]